MSKTQRKEISDLYDTISKQAPEAAAATDTLSSSFKGLTTAVWANVKAFGSWLVSSPLGAFALVGGFSLAVLGAVSAFDNYVKSVERFEKRSQEALDKVHDGAGELETLSSRLEEVNRQIDAMSGKSLVDDSALAKLKSTRRELELLIEAQQEANRENNRELLDSTQEEFSAKFKNDSLGADALSIQQYTHSMSSGRFGANPFGAISSLDEKTGQYDIKTLFLALETYQKLMEASGGLDDYSDAIQEIETKMWDTLSELIQRKQELLAIPADQFTEADREFLDSMDVTIDTLTARLDPFSYAVGGIEDIYDDLEQAFQRGGEIKSADLAKLLNAEQFNSLLGRLQQGGLSLTDFLLNLNETLSQGASASGVESYLAALESLSQELSGLQSTYSTLSAAVEEYNASGTLSMETFQALMALEPEQLALLQDENGALSFNEERLRAATAARMDDMALKQAQMMVTQVLAAAETSEAEALKLLAGASYQAADGQWALLQAQVAGSGATEQVKNRLFQYIANMQNLSRAGQAGLGAVGGGLKSSGKSAGDTARSLKKLNDEARLDKLKTGIQSAKLLIDQMSASLENLDLKMELTNEYDYGTRMELTAQKLEKAMDRGQALRGEFERLAAVTPRTSGEATELANRLEALGGEIRSNLKSVVEYRKALDELRISAAVTSSENVMASLEREQSLLEYNLKTLDQGTLLGGFDFLLPSVPQSAVQRQRRENQQLLAEQERYEQEIQDIKRVSLERQMQENAAERERQRDQLRTDLQDTVQIVADSAEQIQTIMAGVFSPFDSLVQDGRTKDILERMGIDREAFDRFAQSEDPMSLGAQLTGGRTLSWTGLSEEVRARLQEVVGITQEEWARLVEQAPLVAMALKISGTGGDTWTDLIQKLTGPDGLAEAMVSGVNSVISGAAIAAPQISEETAAAYAKLGADLAKLMLKGFNAVTANAGGQALDAPPMGGPGIGQNFLQRFVDPEVIRFGGGFFPQLAGFRGPNVHKSRKAADYPAPGGTPIPALQSGTVLAAGFVTRPDGSPSYGNRVLIQESVPPYRTYVYAHMSRFAFLWPGQKVRRGQVIGYVGTTGNSTGNHLHYGLSGYAQGGVVVPNQNTLVGEEGPELGILPGGRVVLLGRGGAELVDLPAATRIISHPDTEEVLRHTGSKIIGATVPKFATGNTQVDKYLEVPYTYSDAFLKAFAQYSKERQQTLQEVEKLRKTDAAAAKVLLDRQNKQDEAKLFEMQEDMLKNAAAKLEENHASLYEYYLSIADKSDPATLQACLEGLSQIQENMLEVDEKWRALYSQIYETSKRRLENASNLVAHQYAGKEQSRDFAGMAVDTQRQIEIQREKQAAAHAQAEKLRAAGFSEDSQEIQAAVEDWWAAMDTINDLNARYAESIIGLKDEAIEVGDSFDLWSGDNTRADALRRKLQSINDLYKQGYLTEQEFNDKVLATQADLYQEIKSSNEKILDLTMDMIRQEVQNKIEVLNQQKSDYAEIVALKKQALDTARSEADYERSKAEKLKEIAKLQGQIDALANDSSRSGQARRNALLEQQQKLQQELVDTQEDYARERQTETLDKMQEEYEKQKDGEVKALEESIDSQTKLYNLAISRIGEGWDKLYGDLMAYNRDYGEGPDGVQAIAAAWQTAKAAAEEYGGFVQTLPGLQQQGAANQTYTPPAQGADGSLELTGELRRIFEQMAANSRTWHGASPEERRRLEQANEALAAQFEHLSGYKLTKKNGQWFVEGRDFFSAVATKLHSGGAVGGGTPRDNEMLALLEKRELVLDGSKKAGLSRLLDFTAGLSEKLGAFLGGLNALPAVSLPLGASGLVPAAPGAASPTFHMSVNVSGNADEAAVGAISRALRDQANDIFRTLQVKR